MSELEGRFRESLEADAPGTILLETTTPAVDRQGKTLLFTNPIKILTCQHADQIQDLLFDLDEAVSSGFTVAGYFTYEGGVGLQMPDEITPNDKPLIWFGVYRDVLEVPRSIVKAFFDGMVRDGEKSALDPIGRFSIGYNDYSANIAQIRHHIREGDVYQINYTAPIDFGMSSHPLELYRHLRRRQRVEFSAYVRTDTGHILSLSPELFFNRKGDEIVARPMKGTAARGRTRAEDVEQRTMLSLDEKNRAENLMIVDLIRNDLSRICKPGSVEVPALFETELYETVIQMTSTVRGSLRTGITYSDIFNAIFPSGSITGAPKLRAMEIISKLETQPRGVYCGSIGYILPQDEAAFNVAIRTIELVDGQGKMGIGSGVVWDSRADQEYDECLLKASFLGESISESDEDGEPIELIETMKYDGTIPLLDRHIERLVQSATFFGIKVDVGRLQNEIVSRLEGEQGGRRVRVLVASNGTFKIQLAPLETPPEIHRLAVSDHRLDADNVFLFHKTTRRSVYKRELAEARACGFDEVVFLNESGQVAEGAISNIFIERSGELLTPPVSSGLLPGVYRQYILDTDNRAREAVLALDDLRNATQLYICNAVRGLCPAVLDEVES